jgi:hypothetical protein
VAHLSISLNFLKNDFIITAIKFTQGIGVSVTLVSNIGNEYIEFYWINNFSN